MKTTARQDKALLLNTARAVVEELWQRRDGTPLKLRWPSRVGVVNTGGWRACIGNLGIGQPSLQIWLDHFAGYDTRKFYFCLWWEGVAKMRRLADRAAKQLPIHHRITEADMVRDGYYFLSKRLGRSDFGEVILEEYGGKWCYYGIYDLTIRTDATNVNPHLVQRAAAFFESVARTRPAARLESESHAVYPQIENRKIVMSHIQRERSSYLATMRKIHDNYQCQVCGLRFEDAYGAIGKEFAECHHRKPLHQLEGEVTTELKDLATVCANCHRMLHRMTGDFDDVSKLRQVVRRHS